MLDFYADWCISCQEMEAFTFNNAKVKKSLRDFLVLKADVTANDAKDNALLKRLNLIAPPAVLFFSPDRKEQKSYRIMGYMPADKFLTHIESLLGSSAL